MVLDRGGDIGGGLVPRRLVRYQLGINTQLVAPHGMGVIAKDFLLRRRRAG